jgi:hypothetical protein
MCGIAGGFNFDARKQIDETIVRGPGGLASVRFRPGHMKRLNTYFVSRSAAKQGLKVAPSGLGGDEMFGGDPSFSQIPRLLRSGRNIHGSVGRSTERLLRLFGPTIIPPNAAGLLPHPADIASAYLFRRALFLEGELETSSAPLLQLSPVLHLRQSKTWQPVRDICLSRCFQGLKVDLQHRCGTG